MCSDEIFISALGLQRTFDMCSSQRQIPGLGRMCLVWRCHLWVEHDSLALCTDRSASINSLYKLLIEFFFFFFPASVSLASLFLFYFILFLKIFIRLQLSAFSPLPSTPPQPVPPPFPTSTLPLDFVLVLYSLDHPVLPSQSFT